MFFRGPFFRRAPRGAGLLQVELGSLETSEEVAAPTSSPAHLAGFGLWEGKNFGSSVQHGPFFKLAFLARAKLAE